MLTKTVTVEVPAYLYEESQRFATLGLFRDFANVVMAGLRRELREAQEPLVMESDDWKTRLNAFCAQIQKNQTGNSKKKKKTEEELIIELAVLDRHEHSALLIGKRDLGCDDSPHAPRPPSTRLP